MFSRVLVVIGVLLTQSPGLLNFDVVSIKPNTQEMPGFGAGIVQMLPGGRLNATWALPRLLIQNAYGLKPFQIIGGPDWIQTARYDVEAKAADATATPQQRLSMLQSLLEDRFRLKFHRETRELPVYEITIAKSGPRLPEPTEECIGGTAPPPPPLPGQRAIAPCGRIQPFISNPISQLAGGKVSMTALTTILTTMMGRPVIDKTGITRSFDFYLQFAADDSLAGLPRGGPVLPVSTEGTSIFTAFQEQLGLKLESAKGPVEVLIIDSVEKPTPN